MPDDLKNGIHVLRGLYETGINHIADWNKLVPSMQMAVQNLSWLDETINQAPAGLNLYANERLLDYVSKATQEAQIFGSIPDPSVLSFSVVSTSGSAISSEYYQYVSDTAYRFQNDPQVAQWANVTLTMGDELIVNQHRSEVVNERLTNLNPNLGQLYRQAVDSAFVAQASAQGPVEAAAILDRVLERFKGELIGRCKYGSKATYQRISDNLAANSLLTKTVVSDGQATYDTLNLELMRIRKSMQLATGDQMVKLLRQIEAHIIVVTDALDPSKVGINF